MHDFIVKRAVDFVPDLLLHSLRAPAKNARHFYSCFQACILPPNFLTGSLEVPYSNTCTLLSIERLYERTGQSVLFLPVDLSMRAECMHEK